MKQVLVVNFLGGIAGFLCGVCIALASIDLLCAPVLALVYGYPLSPTPLLFIPVIALILSLAAIWLAPSIFHVNYYIRSLVLRTQPSPPGDGYVCQISTAPRQYTGLRGFLEDADDVGWLTVTEDGLRFNGDHTEAQLSWRETTSLQLSGIGWRGL